MNKAVLLLLIFALAAVIFTPLKSLAEPYNHQVDRFFDSPDGRSKVIYNIPIEVRLLDISDDANWYKVQIKFAIGPARFNIVGWAYIPIGDYLIDRQAKRPQASISK
jgi:hypothetical protein